MFVGRRDELRGLGKAIDRACTHPHVVVIEGEPGIGKTSLFDEAIAGARSCHFQIWSATGDELERDRPFGLLADALQLDRVPPDEHRGRIAELLAQPVTTWASAAGEAAELRHQVVEAIGALIEHLASGGPTMLALDDLHWADPSTLLVLRGVERRAAGLPLLVAVATRPMPRSRQLSSLIDELIAGGTTHLSLGPLDDRTVTELLSTTVGAQPGPTLVDLASRAKGNPLYVTELVAGIREDGRLERRGEVVEASTPELPERFPDRVLKRMAPLSPESGDVLRLAAVLGRAFSVTDLATAWGRPTGQLAVPLREAQLAGLVHDDGARLAFRHDLVREAIYRDMPPSVRSALHREVARALAGFGAPTTQVAGHLELGSDDDAVSWLRDAAREAGPRAPEVAVDLLDRALALAGDTHPDRVGLLLDRVEALGGAGRAAEAVTLARELLSSVDPTSQAQLRRSLGHALVLLGRLGEAAVEFESAAEKVGPAFRGRTLAEAAMCRLGNLEQSAAAELAAEAVSAGDQHGDPVATAVAGYLQARIEAVHLRMDTSLERARAVIDQAGREPTGDIHRYQPLFFCGLVLVDHDRLGEATMLLNRVQQLAERGRLWVRPTYHGLAALVHLHLGELDDAFAEATAGVACGEEAEHLMASVLCHSLVAITSLHLGELDRAEQAVAAAEHRWGTTNARLGGDLMVLARARVHEAKGDLPAALAPLDACWDLFTATEVFSYRLSLAPDLVRVASAQGRTDRAEEVTAAAESSGQASGLAHHRAAALYCRGLVDDDPAALDAAVETYRDSPRILDRARACEAAADAHRRRGERKQVAIQLDEAGALYERAGATGDASRLASGPAGTAVHSSPSPWDRLTPRELDVVKLVTAGMTSPQIAARLFVSRRTVETHLYRVFAKLGVSTRVELAVLAEREDAAGRLADTVS